MPIDVWDKNGNHIGIVQRIYPERTDVFMIAVTDFKIEDIEIDRDYIKDHAATILGCKNIFGKINEDKLRNALEDKLNGEYQQFRGMRGEDILSILFLRNACVRGDINIERKLSITIEESCINGYLLFDTNKIKIQDNRVILDEDIDYMDNERLNGGPPILAKIVEYPVVRTDSMGIGEGLLIGADLADMGGRNHVHSTELIIRSGSFTDKLVLPAHINVKKGMKIQLYMEGKKLTRIFCDGIVYEF